MTEKEHNLLEHIAKNFLNVIVIKDINSNISEVVEAVFRSGYIIIANAHAVIKTNIKNVQLY